MTKRLFFLSLLVAGCQAAPVLDASQDPRVLRAAMAFQQGVIFETKEATNLAINGDGFFILARKPEAKDLLFTRDGVFRFEFTPSGEAGKGTYRLVNQDGYYVMGYSVPVIQNQRPFGTPPEEGHDTFTTRVVPNEEVALKPIEVALETNPDFEASFTPQGLLMVRGNEPHDRENRETNIHVALVVVGQRLGLQPVKGTFKAGPYYLYQPAAGEFYAGVAGTGNGNGQDGQQFRHVGEKNTLTPQAAEQRPAVDSLDAVLDELRGR